MVEVNRVIYENIPDSQTAVAALQTGEIDFYEIPPIDLLGRLQSDANIVVENIFGVGLMGYIGINWLYPPFDNVKLRQSLLYIVNQVDMLLPTFADPKWFGTCGSYFACGTPLANDANTDWFKSGPNPEKAKLLMKEGGYDGRPVVMLQATNIAYMSNAAAVMADEMRRVGYNVQVVPMDWGTVVQRRASMEPPEKGGWNIFFTATDGQTGATPYTLGGMATTGKAGWFGWPSDARNEELRAQWMSAQTQAERLRIAREIQDNAWNVVPHMYFGQWLQPAAYRKSTSGWLHMPGMIPFWNVRKL
jgi:peptide/nickel transport system substrate-binding protein